MWINRSLLLCQSEIFPELGKFSCSFCATLLTNCDSFWCVCVNEWVCRILCLPYRSARLITESCTTNNYNNVDIFNCYAKIFSSISQFVHVSPFSLPTLSHSLTYFVEFLRNASLLVHVSTLLYGLLLTLDMPHAGYTPRTWPKTSIMRTYKNMQSYIYNNTQTFINPYTLNWHPYVCMKHNYKIFAKIPICHL